MRPGQTLPGRLLQIRQLSSRRNVLVTGCNGQLGRALIEYLQTDHKVIGVDIRAADTANCIMADVTSYSTFKDIVEITKPDVVYHLPAILSGQAEEGSNVARQALRVNVDSFTHLLRLAHQKKFQIFCPSTIAAFGPESPKDATPNLTIMRPQYLYGITKVYNEMLGSYYHERYGVDYRAVRLPGIVTATPSSGTGTTDYAIEMIRAAVQRAPHYSCYLTAGTTLPMLYIDDCIAGIVRLMEANRSALSACVYNVNGMSFDPQSLYQEIVQQSGYQLPIHYRPDHRQAVANSWPRSLDDRLARQDWNWLPKITKLSQLVALVLAGLTKKAT